MTYGSMKKAAQILGISQPAISRLITSLTESIGFTLFNRQQGGVVPTDDAKIFMADVERMFSGTEELGRRADAIRRKEAGVVRIAAMSHYANDLLPEPLARFSKAHPKMSIVLETRSRIEIGDAVTMGLCDIGITSLPIPILSADVVTLACEPAVAILPVGHPLAEKYELVPTDFEGLRFISFESGTPLRFEIDAVFDEQAVRRDMVLEAGAPEGIVRFVAADAGVSIISPFSSEVVEDERIVARPFVPPIFVEVGLISAKRALTTGALALVEFLKEDFASGAATARYGIQVLPFDNGS
ncbi:DNA-binding transcriptional regulator, LysR family [Tropicimonas isoalkanivorans]|uniref:DNA-binding transcriptional regulator, LysR family n=2 Tax=Tropicimonas isoalkanivorans TaxID=441112 RepID=A0A1I1KQG8_9RHOB|nr:DNA-binding transcriptional regulator, LysR family [Tropicimonas isoalkanivorans]